MDTPLDSIETIMKPTKQYRGFFLFCYFIIIVAELCTGYQLYRVAEAYSASTIGKSDWTTQCATIAIGLRLVCLCLSLIGIFHVRLLPWTIASTCSFIGYVLCVILRLFFLIRYPKKWFISFLFLLQELGFNVVTLLLSLIFAYHSVYVHAEASVSLDVKDPHKEFLDRLIKSILGVIPGLGFFQKWLLRLAKLDCIVCWQKARTCG
ncbi:hypothetical protein WA538_003173 [Blastocystis sp. DL]